jgi:hypothetical protein
VFPERIIDPCARRGKTIGPIRKPRTGVRAASPEARKECAEMLNTLMRFIRR